MATLNYFNGSLVQRERLNIYTQAHRKGEKKQYDLEMIFKYHNTNKEGDRSVEKRVVISVLPLIWTRNVHYTSLFPFPRRLKFLAMFY